jgi:DNA repair protein RAD16
MHVKVSCAKGSLQRVAANVTIIYRRTKIERADDLGLPPRTITVKRGYFSPEERELYMSLFSETRRQFSTYIAEGTILNSKSFRS